MGKFIIIPDVHGRDFWEKVKNINLDEYEKVVFLGDYTDPYRHEGISYEATLFELEEIVDFKRKNNDKVILLIGNHDSYYFWKTSGPSRWLSKYRQMFEQIFEDDRELFQVAFETEKTLFTHAGCGRLWWDTYASGKECTAENINSLWLQEDRKKCRSIYESVSYLRGGWGDGGSCMWADIKEYECNLNPIIEDKYQIFGHTAQYKYTTPEKNELIMGDPIINDKFAMLDCARIFVYDEDKKQIEEYK